MHVPANKVHKEYGKTRRTLSHILGKLRKKNLFNFEDFHFEITFYPVAEFVMKVSDYWIVSYFEIIFLVRNYINCMLLQTIFTFPGKLVCIADV